MIGYTQCTIVAPDKGCIYELISFSFTSSTTATSVSWDFGDGSSSTQTNPFYKYNTTGEMTVKLTLTLTGGPCTVEKKIFIHDKPVPKFSLSPKSNYCLDSNLIVLTDNSNPGSTSSRIESRLILWGDGDRTLNNYPNINSVVSHKYLRDGKFTLDISVTNVDGCVSSTTLDIEILPYYQPSYHIFQRTIECDSIALCFANDSLYDPPLLPPVLKRMTWLWGDGHRFEGYEDTICHGGYITNFYDISLVAEHANGCISTFTKRELLQLLSTTISPSMGDKTKCPNENFLFIQSQKPGVSYDWIIKDSRDLIVDARKGNVYSGALKMPGKYYVEFRALIGSCLSEYFDSIEVVGVLSEIKILNRNQCDNRDTVYFNVYYTMYGTDSVEQIWNFGDRYAPNCTTLVNESYTSCGLSMKQFAKHKYDSMGCYNIWFKVRDLKNGCSDSLVGYIRVNTPDTSQISYEVKKPCAGTNPDNIFTFKVPECVDSTMVNYDSACNKDVFIDFKDKWSYSLFCDPSRWITVGFRFRSGDDTVYRSNDTDDYYIDPGRICIYNIWKHRWFRLMEAPDAAFTLLQDTCPPSVVTIVPTFKNQSLVRKGAAYWDDGSLLDTFTLDGRIDSIGPFSHYFRKSGDYYINLLLESDSGCTGTYQVRLPLGHFANFNILDASCPGAEIRLVDSIRYWDMDPIDPPPCAPPPGACKIAWWRMKSRRDAGKETIKWDLGGGRLIKGKLDEPTPTITYDKAGTYTITMITKNSRNCSDTLQKTVSVSGATAGMKKITKKLLCDDIIQLFDSSKIPISTRLDSIVEQYWDFGDGKTPSYLENPFHYYSSFGTYTITHSIRSLVGCIDTVTTQISIEGPLPKFIIQDSIGCAPLKVTFDNLSQRSSKYIWYFGDPLFTTLSTNLDTNVAFSFTKPGIYYIYLLGSDSVVIPDNSGKIKYCSALFPDTSSKLAPVRRVIVLPDPLVGIDIPDFLCRDKQLRLRSSSDSIYDVFNWNVNGTNITSYQSDTMVDFVADSGKIIVKLRPTYAKWGDYEAVCFDSAFKEIYVSGILADFTYQLDSICNGLSLTDASQQAQNYLWAYTIASNAIGTDTIRSPRLNLNAYQGMVTLRLVVKDSFGCVSERLDSVKLNDIALKYELANVFTPNGDGINDVYDINIKNQNYYHLSIYNRWGEIVYESSEDGTTANDLNWNGMYRNGTVKLPEGAYFYIFETDHRCNPNAKRIKINGTITLIRGE
jgi:gliding motility-associated-like protein